MAVFLGMSAPRVTFTPFLKSEDDRVERPVHIVAGIYSTWKLPKGPEPEKLRSGKVRTDKEQEDEQKIARIVCQAIQNEEDRKKDRKKRGIKKMSLLDKLEEAKAYLSDMRGAKEKDVKDAEKAVEKAEADHPGHRAVAVRWLGADAFDRWLGGRWVELEVRLAA
jgi:hypothetical protein